LKGIRGNKRILEVIKGDCNNFPCGIVNHPLFQHVDFEFLIDEFAKALLLIIEVASMVCRVSTVCILFMNRSSTGKFVHAGE